MDKYKITKDNEDGTVEVVEEFITTLPKAKEHFLEVVRAQSYEYHVAKTLKIWRKICLLDSNDNKIAWES